MNSKEHDATYGFTGVNALVPDSMENPLWVGNVSAEEGDMAISGTQHALRSGTHHSVCSSLSDNGDFSAAHQFPVADCSQVGEFHRQQGLGTADSSAHLSTTNRIQNHPDTVDDSNNQQTTMMDAYIEKFSPAYQPYPVGPGYYPAGGPFTRRAVSIFPEIDLSHRPGSLQEAICMYIDFLMAENEVRTRISECAVASPHSTLDFHREEYYRDVMCRPVSFPTARFRDWLKRYNVDIEITDPDGQTVSQTTFAPAAAVAECAEGRPTADVAGWSYAEVIPSVPHRRRQRSATTRGGVICHGGAGHSPRPIQIGPAEVGHPLLQLQAESGAVPVELISSSSSGPSMQCSVNFTPPLAGTGPQASSFYQAQPPVDPSVPFMAGCGYGSLPEEEDDRKDEVPRSEMPVSGWPAVTLEHPESSRAGTTVDSQNFEEDTSDQPLASSSADAYFQQGGTAGSDGHFDSRCFASDEAAAADKHWTSGVIQSPVATRSVTDVDPTQLDQDHPGNITHAQFPDTSLGHSSGPGLDMNNASAFAVVIEPTSPSGSCTPSGNTTTMVQEFAKCFANGSSAGYQLPYEPGSDLELSADAELSDAAAPEAGTNTPSHSTDTPSCLDLGSDFGDLLGTQHSEEFDYHLRYGNSTDSTLCNKVSSKDVCREPLRRRATRTKSNPKSVTMHDGGPACKSSRRVSTDR